MEFHRLRQVGMIRGTRTFKFKSAAPERKLGFFFKKASMTIAQRARKHVR